MTFRDVQAPNRSLWAALFAGLALALAGALSIVSLNILGQSASFALLPLLVITVWPRRANEVASVIVIFLAGIFTDWAMGGVVGQSALVFTLVWAFMRPELREEPYAIFRAFLIWFAICGVALLIYGITGWFVYRVAPDMGVFGRQILLATLLLPIILLLRHWLAQRFGNTDDWSR